ncbi:PLD nuclease N-terminal domain-containing protein [Curtobacterium sp. MCPF17_002]|uniref:PLD nuclease N-terminal domain-containing protein n=1 Tax=Curtobacterium sp. MCPF17_002 TaxID=2175645 RepID=UPI000DA87E64|nr:PLD nuclease N-terminal domain-containing protein [Curtobacterium sp. MCPF17_002]WIB78219.1 PLD nuclease N-terminal domain-containing protein [Curtobacterium sp. MCPF17_002]
MSVLLYGASIVLLVFALIDILTKGADQVRGLPKVAWVFLVILVPVVGSIVWFAVGHDWSQSDRNHGRYIEPRRHEDGYATLGAARNAHGEKRITGTEQELAELEREIEYWEAQARLRRAKEAAGDGEPTPGS